MIKATGTNAMKKIAKHVIYDHFATVVEALENFNGYRQAKGETESEKQPVDWRAMKQYLDVIGEKHEDDDSELFRWWVVFCVTRTSPRLPTTIRVDNQVYALKPFYGETK